MGLQTAEGQGHPREGQLTWSMHGFQQNLARQFGEPQITSEAERTACRWNHALPSMHVLQVQDLLCPVSMPPIQLVKPHRANSRHNYKYETRCSSTNQYNSSFYLRNIPEWNKLSSDIVEAPSVDFFQARLQACEAIITPRGDALHLRDHWLYIQIQIQMLCLNIQTCFFGCISR